MGYGAAWFFVILGFVTNTNEQLVCKKIEIEITDSLTSQFLKPDDIRSYLEHSRWELQGYEMSAIDIRKLEHELEENPYIKMCDAYTNIDGTLTIRIVQRVPLVRLMPGGRKGYYLDQYT